jgi:hypothetical protein
VGALAVTLSPYDFEASSTAPILNSDERARFDAAIQSSKACACSGHVKGMRFLDIDLPLSIKAPN